MSPGAGTAQCVLFFFEINLETMNFQDFRPDKDPNTISFAARDPRRYVPRHERVTSHAAPADHVPYPQQAQQEHRRPRRLSDLLGSQADYASRLSEASYDHLISKEGKAKKPNARSIYLSTMQRMVIHDLQRDLVRIVSEIRNDNKASPERMESAKRLLEDYCQCNFSMHS